MFVVSNVTYKYSMLFFIMLFTVPIFLSKYKCKPIKRLVLTLSKALWAQKMCTGLTHEKHAKKNNDKNKLNAHLKNMVDLKIAIHWEVFQSLHFPSSKAVIYSSISLYFL